jgi:tetratricopeptide (TPR) repeat protein
MDQLHLYENSQSILEHLKNNEVGIAFEKAKALVTKHPDSALLWYSLGLCYYHKQDNFNAIDSFTRALRFDPSFVSAGEMLLQLNKNNYSIPELKYIYSLIIAYKEGSDEMYQFIQKFKNTPMSMDLSVPNLGQDELKTEGLPGVDDNAYIQHLINEMDKPQKVVPIEMPPKRNLSNVPDQGFTPPPKKNIPLQNNKNDQSARYGIETLTMAKLYIRQGLYEQAMGILMKLQDRDPGSEAVTNEINNLLEIMDGSKELK